MLDLLTTIWSDLDVCEDAMQRNLELTHGLIYSGRVLLALVEAGLPRSEAYGIVQEAARRVWAGDGGLFSHLSADERVTQRLSQDELRTLFDPSYHLRNIEVAFARLGLG
jgi:adenylosuccinate lyase